jgi:hypothetical protein
MTVTAFFKLFTKTLTLYTRIRAEISGLCHDAVRAIMHCNDVIVDGQTVKMTVSKRRVLSVKTVDRKKIRTVNRNYCVLSLLFAEKLRPRFESWSGRKGFPLSLQ